MKSGWVTKSIGDVCEVINGGTPKTGVKEYWGLDHLWITPAEMGKRTSPFVIDTERKISDLGLRDSSARILPPNSIILSSRAPIGHLVINLKPMATNQGCKGLIPTRDLHFKFLYYFLLFNVEFLNSLGSGATFKELSGGKLKEVKIRLPKCIEEQIRISSVLDEAFEDISIAKANAERNLKNARELFESYLHVEHAQTAFLGDLVDIKTGKLDANAAVAGGEYPFFTCSREIYAIDKFAFDCEAILLAGNNAVGDFNVKHYKGKFNAYQRTYVITVNSKNLLNYRFLYFQMLKGLKKFKEQSVGAATKFLKIGMIKELEISLPNLEVQQNIVSSLDSILEDTEHLESIYQKKITALEELKKSLLHRAFNGEL